MELLGEFVEEWRLAIDRVRGRVMGKAAEMRRAEDKENEAEGEFDGDVFEQESLIAGHIPVVKSRDEAEMPKAKKASEIESLGTVAAKRREVVPEAMAAETCGKGVEMSKNADPMRGRGSSANSKLNMALQQLKKRYHDRVNESVCGKGAGDGVMRAADRGAKQPLQEVVLDPPSDGKGLEGIRRPDGNRLYKQAIDHQLLRSACGGRVPQHVYKPRTKIPRVGEDDSITDAEFVVPEFAKDPEINFRVKAQDHKALERYFSRGHEIDVELLFPHVKNVSNNSPNRWPGRSGG